MRRLFAVGALLAAAGCASAFRARIPPSSTAVAPGACAGIWTATFVELQARGFRIAGHDARAGTVQTEPQVMPGRTRCGAGDCAFRDTLHVAVAPHGEVIVRIDRVLSRAPAAASAGPGLPVAWEEPGDGDTAVVAGVLAAQDTILRAILWRASLAPGAPASGPAPGAAAAPASPPATAAAPAPAVDPAPASSLAASPPAVPSPAAVPAAQPVLAAAAAPPPSTPPEPPVAPGPGAVPPPIVAPAAAPPVPPAPRRRLRFVASTGYDFGFEDFFTVTYKEGGTGRLPANGGSTLSVGAAWPLAPGGAWDLRATAGVKVASVSGTNGDAYFLAVPVELLAGFTFRPLRVAAGPSLSLWPRVRGSGVLAGVDRDYRTSLGIAGEVDWVFPFRGASGSFSAGVRYLWQRLEPSGAGGGTDASAIGVAAGVAL